MPDIERVKTLHWLTDPEWFRKAGLEKGVGHDRQHLGIILAAGGELTISQIDMDFMGELTLRLLNGDGRTERVFNFGEIPLTITAPATSVPFVDTPYLGGGTPPTVWYTCSPTSKTLPVYEAGSAESTIFSTWDQQAAEFALIQSRYVRMLVPEADKATLRTLPGGLAALTAYYDNVVSTYNALCGVGFDPELATDLNIHNLFFIKADAGGSGGAYYSPLWAASTGASMTADWFANLRTNWTPLETLGHAYLGSFMAAGSVSFLEVWNKLYAASWQDITLGAEAHTVGWLYQDEAALYTGMMGRIASGTPLQEWSLREKLYFLMLLKYKAGNAAFASFHRQYRTYANALPVPPIAPPVIDMMAEVYASEAGVDVAPFIGLAGAAISPMRELLNMFSDARASYPLYALVSEASLPPAQEALHAASPLQLVDSVEMHRTGLRGSVTVQFAIDQFVQIYGEPLFVMEGPREVASVRLVDTTMTFADMPVGVYTLRAPTGKNRKYAIDPYYLIVKEGASTQTLAYAYKEGSAIVTQTFLLLGTDDGLYGTVRVDAPTRRITVDLMSNPNVAFMDAVYIAIAIRTAGGEWVYHKEFYGNSPTPEYVDVPFEIGYRVEIRHEEPARLRTLPPAPGLILPQPSNEFVITTHGLENLQSMNNPVADLQTRIAEGAGLVRDHLSIAAAPYATVKDDIYLAVMALPEPQRALALAEYADVMSLQNAAPGTNIGNNFLVSLKGLSTWTFFTMTIDLVRFEVRFQINSGKPHNYFGDTYGYVSFRDADGRELFSYDFIGDRSSTAMVRTFPLSRYGGEQYYAFKEEQGARNTIENRMQAVTWSGLASMTLDLPGNGVVMNAAPSEISEVPAVRGNLFTWNLLGSADQPVATLSLDLVLNVLSVTLHATVPSPGAPALYISIAVVNRYGDAVYDIAMPGNVAVAADTRTFPLQKGYTVTVFHQDPTRSQLVNTETQVRTTVAATARYQTMPRGLRAVA